MPRFLIVNSLSLDLRELSHYALAVLVIVCQDEPDLAVLELDVLLGVVEVAEPDKGHALLLAHNERASAAVGVPVAPHVDVLLLQHSFDHLGVKFYFAAVLERGFQFVVEKAPEYLLDRDVFVQGLQWEVQVFLHVLGHILDDTVLRDLHDEDVVVLEQVPHRFELQKD